MLKVKMEQVNGSLQELGMLATLALPAGVAFKAGMIIKSLKDPLEVFSEKRKAVVERLGDPAVEKDKDGKDVLDAGGKPKIKEGEFTFTPENAKLFTEEMKDLGAKEVELNVEGLKASEFGSVSVEPRVFVALDWCITA